MTVMGSIYKLFVPKQAVGANLVYFDLFNASGSGYLMYVERVLPIVSGAVAVVGTVAVDLLLTRTTAVGTGGTAATSDGTSTTACTISGVGYGQGVVPNGVTARITPSGGATAGAVLSWVSVFTEETNAATYMGTLNELWKRSDDHPAIIVPDGTGIRVVQGAVASVGNIGFDVLFSLRNK